MAASPGSRHAPCASRPASSASAPTFRSERRRAMRVQVNARNRAFQFETASGEKILYAGLRAKIGLPYECATGTCGTCKARLIEGRINDGWPQAPGKKSLKADQ